MERLVIMINYHDPDDSDHDTAKNGDGDDDMISWCLRRMAQFWRD